MSKLTEYLKSIGIPAKTITALEKADKDDDKDFDVKPLVEEFNTAQKKLHENDPEMVAEIETKTKGKLMDIWTRSIKKEFNLDATAVKDKSLDEVIKIAKSESTKGLDKNLQEVQQELAAANTKIKELEETEIPKIKGEVENEKKAFKIANKLQGMLPKDDLRVPESTVQLVLSNQLAANYDIDLDDNGDLAVFLKGKKLNPKSKDGTKILTASDIIAEILKENKFIKESNAEDIDPATGKKKEVIVKKTETAGGEKKPALPHMTAAQQHLDNLKKEKAANAAAGAGK